MTAREQVSEQVTLNPTVAIPLDKIRPNRAQVRKAFHGIQELAETIAEQGLLENLIVRPLRSGDYELIAGERRLRALKLLDSQGRLPSKLISCHVRNTDGVIENVVENVMRAEVQPWELGRVYVHLAETRGWSQEEIAAKVGKTQGHVSRCMILYRGIAPAVLERLDKVTTTTIPIQRLMRLVQLKDELGDPDEPLQLRAFAQILSPPETRGRKRTRHRKQLVWERVQLLRLGKIGPIDPLHRPFAEQLARYLLGETKGLEA